MKFELDNYVIGQEKAKIAVSNAVYSHYIRLENNSSMDFELYGNEPQFVLRTSSTQSESQSNFQSILAPQKIKNGKCIRIEKSNVLLIGPTGVGKTYMTKILADLLDVPFVHADCNSFTQAGYVGDDVESVLQKLLVNARWNVKKAQQGIVFLDELDKVACSQDLAAMRHRDVGGEGVQHALLKLVEGTTAYVKDKKGEKVPIDSTDVLFVASGAFTGLEKIVGRRLDKRPVGFGSHSNSYSITSDDQDQETINAKRDKLVAEVDTGDIIKFGMIPELMGRFPVLVPFHALTQAMLVRTLIEPENSLVAQMQRHFEMDNVSLIFDDDALLEIAQDALNRGTGARGLRSIMEKVLEVPKFEVPGSNIISVRITRDVVRGQTNYECIQDNSCESKRRAAGDVKQSIPCEIQKPIPCKIQPIIQASDSITRLQQMSQGTWKDASFEEEEYGAVLETDPISSENKKGKAPGNNRRDKPSKCFKNQRKAWKIRDAKTDPRNLLGVVMEEEDGFYRIGTDDGILSQQYSRNQIEPSSSQFVAT
ncbi:AAA domain (Cdc48 subfamily) domain-containing protein [Ditylenchus destructor]|uniref:AAA domain (Cdc48 subfamily) domain-containing protein n=1 Tax=Ditylenchus destructor TaxID=166010 RepID=A0AAD4MVE9_9BILA|nr:AAA domain (Cdc48 subfamily) domain-containing protein [Ditylenchus destructor]